MSDTPAAETEVRVTAELAVIRPGDTVLVRASGPLDQAQTKALKEQLHERLPGVTCSILTSVDGIHVYRPDTPTSTDRDRIINALRHLAPKHPVTRVWGHYEHATPDDAQEGNAWAADVEDIADVVLRTLGRQ